MKMEKASYIPLVDDIIDCGRIHCDCTSPNVCIYSLTPNLVGTREYNIFAYFDQPGIILSTKGKPFHAESIHQVSPAEKVKEYLDRNTNTGWDYFKVIVSPTKDFFCDGFEAWFICDYLRFTLSECHLCVADLKPADKHLAWYLDAKFPFVSDLIEHILFLDKEFVDYVSQI